MRKTARNNILIVAITRLGDMLQCSPTIVGLKQENPNARITVVIDKQFAGICTGIPGIDEIYVLDLGYLCRCLHQENEGIAEAYQYLQHAVNELREKKFDLALNMSNSAYTALLIKMLKIEDNRGWLSDEEGFRLMADPWAMLFAAFVYYSNRDYNSLNLVDIFRCAADVTIHPNKLCYNTPEDAIGKAEEFLKEDNFPSDGPLICIQAGASQAKRQWAPERFSKLSKLLVENLGARIVFTGTTFEEPIVNAILEGYSSPRIKSAIGKTGFNTLAALLSKADLLITGDTGPMHLAVAVGTPVVAIFLASALCFETGPYSKGNFVLQPQISCSPCNPNYPCNRPDCHLQITPELVAYLAALRLETAMGAEREIKIPSSVADPRQVVVYYTDFDHDGFLDFYPMTQPIGKNGEPVGFYDSAKAAYRALWKEEFMGIEFKGLVRGVGKFDDYWPKVHQSMEGLQRAIKLCEDGVELVKQLVTLVKDVRSEPRLLGETDAKITAVDKELELVAMEFPIIDAIIRIFIMEKENIRGDNLLLLASKTDELYSRLTRRCIRFGELFSYFFNTQRNIR